MKKFMIAVVAFTLFHLSCAYTTDVIEERGGKVKAVKYADGTWKLFVNGKPYFIKGVLFSPVKIGEDPGRGTLHDWMCYDDDKNGKNDAAYQSWLDENRNNVKDPGEKIYGDFQLLKEMGCNTIRLYHIPSDNPILGDIYRSNPNTAMQYNHPLNKNLLRALYKDYGIMAIMGNFLGSWTIGSGASWEQGTDYTNPQHRENIKKSVRAMVLDNKDESYVLMWLLGNENNIASWSRCNAQSQSLAYATLVGELAEMIHKLDPEHPVAVCEGDDYGWGTDIFTTLKYYPKYAPGVDIIAYNSYRGKDGFGDLWAKSKNIFDRPVFISEFGIFAYNTKIGEDEELQLEYDKGCWQDIVLDSAEYYEQDKTKAGNCIGGVVFDWLDRWYMDSSPYDHNEGSNPWVSSPDKLRHEEWFGVMSMGNGSDWLMRHKRKVYDYFKDVWNFSKLSF